MKTIDKILLVFVIIMLILTIDLVFPSTNYTTEKLNSITYLHTNEVRSNFDTFSVDYDVSSELIGKQVLIVERKYIFLRFLNHKDIHPQYIKS